jgi:diguanylate cyclase (GGDEF)-like protein
MDGLELCRRVKADPDKRYHYIIVLTSRSSTDDTVAALEAGADDFIAKPYHPEELRVRVRAGLRILHLQTELRVKASHDELTGVMNRRIVIEMLDREIDRTRRDDLDLTVGMIDIDHFKEVNDRHGHLVGDEVLRQAAQCIAQGLRRSDLMGRFGGEEFLIALPGCDAEAAAVVAERVRAAISANAARTAKGAVHVTVSIGLACTGAWMALDRDALIGAADKALYRAKAAGRNRIEFAMADEFVARDRSVAR